MTPRGRILVDAVVWIQRGRLTTRARPVIEPGSGVGVLGTRESERR